MIGYEKESDINVIKLKHSKRKTAAKQSNV